MDRLRWVDINRIKSLAIAAKIDVALLAHAQSTDLVCELTDNEITQLASTIEIKNIMILMFVVENITLEFIRKNQFPYRKNTISMDEVWNDVEELIVKRLFLSREIAEYFKEGPSSKRFNEFLALAKTFRIDNLVSEVFVNDNQTYHLYVTGKFEQASNQIINENKFTMQNRKTGCHVGLYDPFQFKEPETYTAYQFLNTNANRKNIYGMFTLKFAYPELTVLKLDGSYIKIFAGDIPDFLEENWQNNEIDDELYQAIKYEYPALFLPPIDQNTVNELSQKIKNMIDTALGQANQKCKPLLIVLSEVHGSKGSFILHVIITLLAHNLGFRHLLAETINIQHERYGWDPHVEPMLCLLTFAKQLGFNVKDLESELHYQDKLTQYPYHAIPYEQFGEQAREQSWIVDTKSLNKNAILIVGSGHMNNILNSELKEFYHMLPIDCTCDKAFSNMLSIFQHNFINVDKSLNRFSLDEIIQMVKRSAGL